MGVSDFDIGKSHLESFNGSMNLGLAFDVGKSNLIQPAFYFITHRSFHDINGQVSELVFTNRGFHLLYGKSTMFGENFCLRGYIGPGLLLPYKVKGNNLHLRKDDLNKVNMNLKVKLQLNIAVFHIGGEYVWGLTNVIDNQPSKWDYFNLIIGATLL
jgi:hypothetical protein